jgi:ribonuclease VapC
VKHRNAVRPVFDASAVLALLQGESGAERLKGEQPDAVVNAVNAAEVVAKLVTRGMPAADALSAYDALHLETTSFGPAMARVSSGFVHKGVSLGDRCFLAAVSYHGTGWTSDHDLGKVFGDQIPTLKFFR